MKVRFLKEFDDIETKKHRVINEIDEITKERYDELVKYDLVEIIIDIETSKDENEKKPRKRAVKK